MKMKKRAEVAPQSPFPLNAFTCTNCILRRLLTWYGNIVRNYLIDIFARSSEATSDFLSKDYTRKPKKSENQLTRQKKKKLHYRLPHILFPPPPPPNRPPPPILPTLPKPVDGLFPPRRVVLPKTLLPAPDGAPKPVGVAPPLMLLFTLVPGSVAPLKGEAALVCSHRGT